MPDSPFNDKYFYTDTYEKVSFVKYSQYWFSNRFYAMLARRYAKTGGRLLEEGCGLGHLIGQLEADFIAHGMDINPWALKQAKEGAAFSVFFCASAESLPYGDGTLQAIISKHVVEHLHHPDVAIREMGRTIGGGGILILATPNLASLLKPLKGERWIGYQDPTHISLHTPQEWRKMLEAADFKIIRTFSDGFWDVPYIRGVPAKIQKIFFGSLGGFQALTGLVFLPLRWGESVIFIARKNEQKP
ncbi:MAG: hypothetical protein C0391_06500 [Anaerolinea sp.]|nr:hypothetical protein [Anaerolinea sp.]